MNYGNLIYNQFWVGRGSLAGIIFISYIYTFARPCRSQRLATVHRVDVAANCWTGVSDPCSYADVQAIMNNTNNNLWLRR